MKINESNSPDVLEQQQDHILLFLSCKLLSCGHKQVLHLKAFLGGSCDQMTKMELVKQKGEQHFWTALALMGD